MELQLVRTVLVLNTRHEFVRWQTVINPFTLQKLERRNQLQFAVTQQTNYVSDINCEDLNLQ